MGSTPPHVDEENTVTIAKGDSLIVATDEETGVSSQGETKAEALANLAEALDLYEAPVDDETEPDEASDAPWFE